MGGHAGGEVASNLAVTTVQQHVVDHRGPFFELLENDDPETKARASEELARAVQRACSSIFELASSDRGKHGMGTTFTGVAVAGSRGVIAHVGDSRAYLFRQGRAHRLTEDHTMVSAQLKAGIISREEAAASKLGNVLTRAVGAQENVQVDTLLVDFLPNDLLLICSDGLHGYIDEPDLPTLLLMATPQALPDKLVALANERGG